MTTEQLIQKCIDKDHVAWDEFVRRYRGVVTRSVRYKLKRLNVRLPESEYHDIVQEVFLLIWEKDKLTGIRDINCINAWLAMLSVNKTFNYCKNKKFRLERAACSLDEDINSDNPGLNLGSILPSEKLNTEDSIRYNEMKNILETEIAHLNYKQKLALKLNIYDGKKQKDIAEIMKAPESTVATWLSVAKNSLKEKLGQYLKE